MREIFIKWRGFCCFLLDFDECNGSSVQSTTRSFDRLSTTSSREAKAEDIDNFLQVNCLFFFY